MTISELMMMPVGVTLEEWENTLKERKKVVKRIRKLSDEIDGEAQSLEVLKDEIGSERWMKHNTRLFNLTAKRDKLIEENKEWL